MNFRTLQAWERHAAQRAPTRFREYHMLPKQIHWTQHEDHGPSASILRNPEHQDILDLGCGTADAAAFLASKNNQVTCIDMVEKQVLRAQARWAFLGRDRSPGTPLKFVAMEAVKYMKQTDQRFDMVISVMGAFSTVPPPLILEAVRRVIKLHGTLAFSVTDRHSVSKCRGNRKLQVPANEYTEVANWREILPLYGFEDAEPIILDCPRVTEYAPCTTVISARYRG